MPRLRSMVRFPSSPGRVKYEKMFRHVEAKSRRLTKIKTNVSCSSVTVFKEAAHILKKLRIYGCGEKALRKDLQIAKRKQLPKWLQKEKIELQTKKAARNCAAGKETKGCKKEASEQGSRT